MLKLVTFSGKQSKRAVTVKSVTREFSLKELVDSFGTLSDWDQLTLQQKGSLERRLPPLWADPTTFEAQFEKWADATPSGGAGWLGKMASAWRSDSRRGLGWLQTLRLGDGSHFAAAATVEAVALERIADDEATVTVRRLLCDIRERDCLAEWAARLMARCVCLGSRLAEQPEALSASRSLSLSHALRWCASANEMALPSQVLNCLRTIDKKERGSLAWLNQELTALRRLALNKGDVEGLSVTLKRAEVEAVLYREGAPLEHFIGINNLELLLNRDLKCKPIRFLYLTLSIISQQGEDEDHTGRDTTKVFRDKGAFGGAQQEGAPVHGAGGLEQYDALWEQASAGGERDSILTDMAHTLDWALALGLALDYAALADLMLHRVGSSQAIGEEAARAVVKQLETLAQLLDEFAVDALKGSAPALGAAASRLVEELLREESAAGLARGWLQLVADPEHSLLHYCRELHSASERGDGAAWANAFGRMRRKMFENPHAGPDYKVLGKHQGALYALEDFDPEKKESTKQTLARLVGELDSSRRAEGGPRQLRLSQLCPALARLSDAGASETACLSRLLGLPRGGRVHKFEEQVTVFRSARRPALVTILLADGQRRRLLVKGGEPLRRDAAAMRLLRTLTLGGRRPTPRIHYNVTPLGEDCGLIEYLEDHETLRSVISSRYDLEGVLQNDVEDLNPDPEECLRRFRLNCSKVPAHSLRSVMEFRSPSVEDFIARKRRFQECLSVVTFSSWILGLGDRHLDNLMYSNRDGSLVPVDWNPVLRHGRAELPPARLTRALLAPCSPAVLESQLQQLAESAREHQRILMAVFRVSFGWMGRDFEDGMRDVGDLVSGSALPHQVSLRGLQRSPGGRAARGADLLKRAFHDCVQKESYCVQEQISDLLRHCTDPRVLSVTRSPWEPWV
ncbi:unnamed protein product, partial [Iphiclides podalirius]